METIEKMLEKKESCSWVPACGGAETPFTKNDRVYLYMYNTFTNKHAYYCQTSDLFLSDKQTLDIFG